MQPNHSRTPVSAKIIFGVVIIVSLWTIGTMAYNKGEDDGRQQEIITTAGAQEEVDRQYFNSLMSNCLVNQSIPFDLSSNKPLNKVCGCANTTIKEQATRAGMRLSDYHRQQVTAAMEKEIYQGCI